MQREELRDGCLSVLRGLYSADKFFKRMDLLYLDRALGESKLRQMEMKQKPIRHALNGVLAVLITAAVFCVCKRR